MCLDMRFLFLNRVCLFMQCICQAFDYVFGVFISFLSVTFYAFVFKCNWCAANEKLEKKLSMKAVGDNINYYRDEIVTYFQQCVSYMSVIAIQDEKS